MEIKDFLEAFQPVEKKFEKETKKLGWEYTDVLYSFLGIYVIGLYAFDKEKSMGKQLYRRIEDGFVIFVGDTNQRLYLNNYILKRIKESKQPDNFSKLNQLKELKDFLSVYNSIGNVIPIWPGGNESRGKFDCYDLPELYFLDKKIAPWTKYLLEKYDLNLFPDVDEINLLHGIESRKTLKNKSKTVEFLDALDVESYKKYLVRITKNIEEREKYLNKKLDYSQLI